MSSTSPPPEAQRYGRSQTPESPRPVHIPEPSNIPVLLNQMDPVFNNTTTYNIPEDQTFSPIPHSAAEHVLQKPSMDDLDAVQSFFREAENQAALEPVVTNVQTSTSSPLSQNQTASFLPIPANNHDEKSQTGAVPNSNVPPEQLVQTQEIHQANSSEAAEQPGHDASFKEVDSIVEPKDDQPKSNDDQALPQEAAGLAPPAEQHQDEVDYQSLLDNITQSASKPSDSVDVMVTEPAQEPLSSLAVLPPVPGLPPKPPPQEHPLDFPSYVYPGSVHQQQTLPDHFTSAVNDNVSTSVPVHVGTIEAQSGTGATQALQEHVETTNGFSTILPQPQTSLAPGQSISDSQHNFDPVERPWSPHTQGLYDQFLEEERRYVTEGIWDKFPVGSRLFVGNLPSEKVTKRDLFHKFHQHGKLAQISIKQAYGFVQFLEATSCSNALNTEQGVEIRGRKVHLEISKPQKNTRGAGNKSNQAQARRRSRSPDRHNRRNYSDFRDDSGRRSNDYRGRRSPSPRGYRGRDDYRPSPHNGRPRSPIYPPNYAGSQHTYDDEANLPLPRRDPRSAPDVQLLVLEPEVDQSFINWVEQGFRMKGLQASTMWLNSRLPLAAVIKRQIIEGVQAVVKLIRMAQSDSKIPLQVFDRSAGVSNVNFNEYVDLDLSVAADIVLQARMRERSPSQPLRPPSYPPQSAYPYATQYSHQPPPPNQYPTPIASHYQSPPIAQYAYTPQPNTYGPPSAASNQSPNLQQLLANLRQPSGQPGGTAIPSGQPVNGAANTSTGQNQYAQNSNNQPPYGQFGAASAAGYPTGPQLSPSSQPNVQNIMEQLARYQR